ncbi:MAG TPA: hypothetical protein VHB46_19345 [Burkholderiales bacterium]|nr:hypothetical protein [Burkholderiales bacterium]
MTATLPSGSVHGALQSSWGPPVRFRRHADSDVWHSDHLCTRWPQADFEESDRPTLGKLCEECKRFDQVERSRRKEDHGPRGSWE